MNIVACIKQVPDVPNIRIDQERMTVIREGVESIINPLDWVALEIAMDLRAKEGGRVTVLTMGPPQSEEALREAFAVGSDDAILLSDPALAGADTLATSHALARGISKLNPFPDLILCGMHSIDSDTGHVGPQIAEELDLPQVCGVTEIHREDDFLMVKRFADGFVDTLRVSMPALLAVGQGPLPLRHLDLGALETAFSKKNIVRWSLAELALERHEVGFSGSATQVWRLRPPPLRKEGELVTGSPQTLVERFIRKLEALTLLDEENGNE